MNQYLKQSGQSLIEVIIAIAIFGMFAAAISTYALGGLVGQQSGMDHVQAQLLAQQGVEAVRAIRDRAWNENTFNQSAVQNTANQWFFTGEGSTETIGKFTRTITFNSVCRNASNDIVVCPGTYTDPQSRKATVSITWSPRIGATNTIQQITYLTNWSSRDWAQTNWSGGSGQATWSDITKYDTDDAGVSGTTVAGELQLATAGGAGTWAVFGSETFDTTDTDFNQGSYVNTQVTGTGANASIILTQTLASWATNSQSGIATTQTINSTSIVLSDDIWAVGGSGKILHFNGTVWSEYVDTGAMTWTAIAMVSTLEGWVVGSTGTIYHYLDGTNDSVVNGTWSNVTSPTTQQINKVYAIDANNVWAVANSGKILKYNGTSWSEFVDTGNDTWKGIYMLSTTDGWVVGNGGEIIHFNGTNWTTTYASGVSNLNSVHFVSAGDGWAIGSSGKIIHWNGTAWSTFATTGSQVWNSITMVSAIDGWVAGNAGALYHYVDSTNDSVVNGTWSAVVSGTANNLFSIRMVSSSIGWAVGASGTIIQYSAGYNPTGQFFSRINDGGAQPTNWKLMVWTETLPAGAGITIAWRAGSTPVPDGSWSAFGIEYADELGSNITGAAGRYLQYRVTFTRGTDILLTPQLFDVNLVINRPSVQQINAVDVLSETNAWDIGGGGKIGQFDGTTWNEITSPAGNTMNTLHMRTASDGWSAGANGKIWHYNGTLWSEFVDTGNDTWRGISMIDAADGFVVDLNGAIRRYNGTAWNSVTTPVGVSSLYSVYSISSSNAWAAGDDGKILFWNGSAWAVYTTTAGAEDWRSIIMVTPLQGWVVGLTGKIYRYVDSTNNSVVDGTWTSIASSTTNNLNSVSMGNANAGWAVGDGGKILNWNGVIWTTATTPTLIDLAGVKMLTPQLGWAVGKNGIILQFIGGTNFTASGILTSSAFDTGATSSYGTIDWDQTIPSCTPACTVRFQVRTAPDNAGAPGIWTSWYGATGAGTYFTVETGTLLPAILNNNRWAQYRVYLDGDLNSTPVVSEVRINYMNN